MINKSKTDFIKAYEVLKRAYTVSYNTDILGEDYEQTRLRLPDDKEGRVAATLVRKRSETKTGKAVLYLHGYVDYFFQTEMAEQFNKNSFDFYALDFKKYGRSYMSHQTMYDVGKLEEYDIEIEKALSIIEREGHNSILLAGHSTGGLIAVNFLSHHKKLAVIKAAWLNSPFFEFNKNFFLRKIAVPVVSEIGEFLPGLTIDSGLPKEYVQSLHKSFKGEWDFNLDWKPVNPVKSTFSFISAIHAAQKNLHSGISVNVPVMVMHSDKSAKPKGWTEDCKHMDIILDVNHIKKFATYIKGDVTIQAITNGVHDLVLSEKPVRDRVYNLLFEWLNQKM